MPRRSSKETLEWADRDTYETIRLVAKAYRLRVEAVSPRGPRRALVTLAGRENDLARMSRDRKSFGAPEPFVTGCPPTREEYLGWLANELAGAGVDFAPKGARAGPAAVESG